MKLGWGWIIAALWAWIFVAAGGEGHVLPAATFDITQMERAQQPAFTRIRGRVNRLRHDCSFRSMRWYLGKRNDINVPTGVRILPGPKVRVDGWTPFGPWEIEAPLDAMVDDRVFADAYHQCKLFGVPLPWLTRSKVWN